MWFSGGFLWAHPFAELTPLTCDEHIGDFAELGEIRRFHSFIGYHQIAFLNRAKSINGLDTNLAGINHKNSFAARPQENLGHFRIEIHDTLKEGERRGTEEHFVCVDATECVHNGAAGKIMTAAAIKASG